MLGKVLHYLKLALCYAEMLIRALVFVIASIPFFFLIIVIPYMLGGERGEKMSERFCVPWFKMLFFVFGIKLKVRREAEIQEDKFIIFSNHLSFLDIPAIVLSFPGKSIKFLAKEAVARYPLIGWGIKIQRHPIVKKKTEFSCIRYAINLIEKNNTCICIFPEGTRNKDPRNLLPFKDGTSFIFTTTRNTIVPAAILGTEKSLPVGSILPRKGTIYVTIGSPIIYRDLEKEIENFADKKAGLKSLSDIMRTKLEALIEKTRTY